MAVHEQELGQSGAVEEIGHKAPGLALGGEKIGEIEGNGPGQQPDEEQSAHLQAIRNPRPPGHGKERRQPQQQPVRRKIPRIQRDQTAHHHHHH